ncbi:nitroreductase [Mycolicibacterium vanbaalenii PYR-1]|uniref:Nitroreductase n=1 Tax=Mycolicibacterium vanbaalenii (strain DSM 7251 / JCM 13017 / BCRC 16820 / KCTC 9966 / NRRL B-24157 / PYR-1) TaxID=350058 RepID=A1THV4_MYCVP|nr:nitroreductase [Mycolicibacterium vanbaalenii PYR-1]
MTSSTGHHVIDLMLARRSVREGFASTAIPVTQLEAIVACGLAAPSSKNAQPWRLHVVQSRTELVDLAAAVRGAGDAETYVPYDPSTGEPHPQYRSSVAESADVLGGASAAIFIENRGVFSGGRRAVVNATREALTGSITGYGFELIGLGAAIENMWLAANALGIGATFMGDVVIAEEAIKRVVSVTGDVVGVLALGHIRPDATLHPRPAHEPDLAVWY